MYAQGELSYLEVRLFTRGCSCIEAHDLSFHRLSARRQSRRPSHGMKRWASFSGASQRVPSRSPSSLCTRTTRLPWTSRRMELYRRGSCSTSSSASIPSDGKARTVEIQVSMVGQNTVRGECLLLVLHYPGDVVGETILHLIAQNYPTPVEVTRTDEETQAHI